QRDSETVLICTSDVVDQREVMDSGGHKEDRWVIGSRLTIGIHSWPIELTLTARDDMRFRMLIGRHALKNRALVDPGRSYLIGKRIKNKTVKSH
ncbi:MAG: ATP-dependent zinc protease, partial [Gammaproteobacteria bacterium]|nr:ATP-dependent zinc protease [Gammaproteobacteria bacterium]